MLNGVDPILIFRMKSKSLSKSVGSLWAKMPLVSENSTLIDMPAIPVYLSQTLTGLLVLDEDKSLEITTDTQTLAVADTDGETVETTQKGSASTVTISMTAKKNSIGWTLLAALLDTCFEKLSTREYSVSYLNGSTFIFDGLIDDLKTSTDSDTDKVNIVLTLTRGRKEPKKESNIQISKPENPVNLDYQAPQP